MKLINSKNPPQNLKKHFIIIFTSKTEESMNVMNQIYFILLLCIIVLHRGIGTRGPPVPEARGGCTSRLWFICVNNILVLLCDNYINPRREIRFRSKKEQKKNSTNRGDCRSNNGGCQESTAKGTPEVGIC